jgi:adenylylsulfate kinase-like enzyme
VSAPYEEPVSPEVTIDSEHMPIEEQVRAVRELMGKLRTRR